MMAGAAHTEQMVAWGQALASAVKGPVSHGFFTLSPTEISEAASECQLER